MRESVDRIIRGLFRSKLEKGEKGRQREREWVAAESQTLKVLDVRVTCRCHVTRGAVDPRGASSLRTKIAMAAAFWARPAIFQSQPIFPTRDTECLTIIRLAAVHLYRVLEIHPRQGNDSPDRFESLNTATSPPPKETDLFPSDFRFQPEYFLLYRGRSRSIQDKFQFSSNLDLNLATISYSFFFFFSKYLFFIFKDYVLFGSNNW